MNVPPPHLMRLLEAIRVDHPAVTYHPDDPHREAIEMGAAVVGLIPVPDANIEYRRFYGCPAPAGRAVGRPAPTRALREPPPGVLVRTEWGGVIWQRMDSVPGDGEWIGHAPNGTRPVSDWETIAEQRKYGPVEFLIPVPAYAGGVASTEQLAVMLDHMVAPIIEAMEHLGAAAVAGFRSLLGEAYQRGERAHADAVTAAYGAAPIGVEELLRQIRDEQDGGRGQ